MRRLILLIVLLAVVAAACEQPVACTQEAKLCPDGSAVGRSGPNCEFAECPVRENNSVNRNYCSPPQRQGDVCIQIYQPVCGWFDPAKIQCIKYPCAQTFSNSCFACHDEKVLYWTEGECPK